MIKRTLSGAVYVSVIVGAILAPSSVFFAVLCAVLCTLGIREMMHLTGKDTWLTWMSVLTSLCIVAMVWIASYFFAETMAGRMDDEIHSEWLFVGVFCALGILLIVLFFMTMIAELFRKETDALKNRGRYLQAVVMIGIPFATMAAMCAIRPMYLLALFVSIWVNDTGAYLVGMATSHLPGGNHKMFVRISPKKSWEGLIGGIVFNLLAGYVFYRVGWIDALNKSMVFVLLASVFGTLGDLIESQLKRSVGVKDSGRFMPGHGGVLDRFDSMLLAAPSVGISMLLLGLIETM